MLLHDINSTDADNSVAMQAARQSVDLIRSFPQIVIHLQYKKGVIRDVADHCTNCSLPTRLMPKWFWSGAW